MKNVLASLALVLLHTSVFAWPDNLAGQPASARCELPSGVEMILHYFPPTTAHRKLDPTGANVEFFTNRGIVGANGVQIPFGIYEGKTARDPGGWALVMRQVADDGITPPKSPSPPVFHLPMALTKSASRSPTLVVSFDASGRACSLRFKWQNMQALVAFAENYEDLSTVSAVSSQSHK